MKHVDIQRTRALIGEIEATVLNNEETISKVCEADFVKSKELRRSSDALSPILRTALVINWKESAMRSRYDRFRERFPHVRTLYDLKIIIESFDAFDFCIEYLNIRPNQEKADQNPKYALLKTLVEGFLEYKSWSSSPEEIDAIRQWAEHVNIKDLKNDFIGKRRGVGIGVVENIRLNLGYTVIKPDRHVIGVVKHFLKIDIRLEEYHQLSTILGLDARYFDCLLFRFGQLKNISN